MPPAAITVSAGRPRKGVDRARNQIARAHRRQVQGNLFHQRRHRVGQSRRSRACSNSIRIRATTSSPASPRHKAVLDSCRTLERNGRGDVTYLKVDKYGMVDPGGRSQSHHRQPCSSRSCTPTMRSARFIRFARSARLREEKGRRSSTAMCVQAAGKIPLDVEKGRHSNHPLAKRLAATRNLRPQGPSVRHRLTPIS